MNDLDFRAVFHQSPPQSHAISRETHLNEWNMPNKRHRSDKLNDDSYGSEAVIKSTIDNDSATNKRRKVRSNSRWETQKKADTDTSIEMKPDIVGTVASKQSANQKLIKVSFSEPSTLKQRETIGVSSLYAGEQCSSCGIRFSLNETENYKQHLDWHFRKNRRNRDPRTRAQLRNFFLQKGDWFQSEEFENVEEREKSWFELQQDIIKSNQGSDSPIVQPSCTAGPNDQENACDICYDPFEMYYDDESEEWCLRNAIRVDERVYHPICFGDYKDAMGSKDQKFDAIDDAVKVKDEN